ncbi:hypothetical protein FRC07_004934 [Ceratobasidium sp. 392]|nr:hypothetical protein FRC07_004934 [Ceratobasidium sp. 392]
MTKDQPVANRIAVNSAEQDDQIDSVAVFQANRAEVKRRVKLELKQGQNHVDIERLPTCINEDSIRVDGTGNAVIFDVVYHSPYKRTSTSAADDPHQQAVEESRRTLESLRKEREVAQEQSSFLNSYGKTLDSKNINTGDVERFLDMFGPRQVAIAKRIQELDVQIELAEKTYNEAQAKVYADQRGAKRGTKITVTVLAEVDGEAELMLTYIVSNASWTPLYDVRASIAKSPDAKATIALHYRASITQTTGENWPDVALTLSTASPQLGSEVPNLSAWRIGFPAPPPAPAPGMPGAPRAQLATKAARRSVRMLTLALEASEDLEESIMDNAVGAGAPAPRMAARSAKVLDAGVLSATFGIPGRSDIPSDESSHKVVIAVLELDAELEWVCIPREKESVFLRCKVLNASEFTLLPGEASVFMDDNFVSKSRIEHVAPNDSFRTSLGTDSALRVTYPSVRTLNRTINLSNFFASKDSKQSVATHSQRITVRNSRPATVSGLRIFDHVPVSTDAKIKVDVLSPNGLGPVVEENETSDGSKNKDRAWANVKEGVKARWANLDVGGEGTVEWECEMQPNEELELELAWEVSAPAGQKWQTVYVNKLEKHVNYIQKLGEVCRFPSCTPPAEDSIQQNADDFEYRLTLHLRLNAVYWGFTVFSMMGQPTALERDGMVEFVMPCWDEREGAFGTFPGHDVHILPTLSAIQILLMQDALDKLDKYRVTNYILSLQALDGSFAGDRWGEIDTRFTYCATSALSLLGELPKLDVERTLGYIRKCRRFYGAFGASEGAESHATQVFVCLATLAILDRLEEVDQPTLAWWLAERRLPNGGLNGRPEKLEDASYNFDTTKVESN